MALRAQAKKPFSRGGDGCHTDADEECNCTITAVRHAERHGQIDCCGESASNQVLRINLYTDILERCNGRCGALHSLSSISYDFSCKNNT